MVVDRERERGRKVWEEGGRGEEEEEEVGEGGLRTPTWSGSSDGQLQDCQGAGR